MTREEVRVDLNMDTSVLGRAKREIEQFSRDGHLGFLHAGNGAREFKKSLHELADQIPVVGVAIKALLSPIGATLTGATLLFEAAKKSLDDWNKDMDKAAEDAAKPVGLVRAELSKLAIERQKQASDEKHWLQSLREEHNAELSNLEDRLKLSEKIYETRKKELGVNPSDKSLQHVENQKFIRDIDLFSAASLAVGDQIPGVSRMASGANKFRQGIAEQIAQTQKSIAAEETYGKGREEKIAGADSTLSNIPWWRRMLSTVKQVSPGTLGGVAGAVSDYQLGKTAEAREKASKEEQASIDRYKKLEETLKQLNSRLNESTFQSEKWKHKVEELTTQQQAIDKARSEYLNKNFSPSINPAGGGPIDPVTGGIRSNPLVGSLGYTPTDAQKDMIDSSYYDPNSGGFKYRPIKGAPGFKAPTSDVVALDPTKQAQAVVIDLLMQQLRGKGIPVIGAQ